MSCLGVHFAFSADDVAALQGISDEQERLAFLQEELEERYFAGAAEYIAQSDKSWDAMHRTLSNGQLTWDGGTFPLNHTVLAGTPLYSGDDYIMSLKTPEQVKAVASAIEHLTISDFREAYERIDAASYDGEIGDEDFTYTWEWFQDVRALYLRAAAEGRFVLFAVDY
ncbi:hypothetical protein ABAC460_13100 [Asticcacaulis sp. AC460]|uniref:YfbM family protein n=1 Tax=Asticcacaulis sp. AC460 TaxID=1282360 RepID=UPI0003C3B950|nr:YfbM family protein [Asticcacaulis sp. AC460]ESQ89228.1 hypothetical protein ABAC460_13100 [Asticcacaulis sp. AC460]